MRNQEYYGLALIGCLSTVLLACSSTEDPNFGGGAIGGSSAQTATGGSGSVGGKSSKGSDASQGGDAEEGGASPIAPPKITPESIDTSGTEATPTEIECAQREVPIKALPPDIMLVMDRSMSMTDDVDGQPCEGEDATTGFGNCGEASKWYLTIEALKSVVQDTQRTVNWGMFWLGNEATQCGAATSPVVEITEGDSYTPIQEALDGYDFSGQIGTPTAAVVNNAVKYMKTLTAPNPKYLLVATDGEPNCAGGTLGGFGATNTVDTAGATKAVEAAAKAGMPTFVIGIATASIPAATDALNSMAVAGGNPQEGGETQFYAVSDSETLKEVLNKIIGKATSCTVSLENAPSGDWTIAIAAHDPDDQLVEIVNDPDDGWSYTDEKTKASIELRGSACDKLKDGTYTNLQFVYTCPTHDIVL